MKISELLKKLKEQKEAVVEVVVGESKIKCTKPSAVEINFAIFDGVKIASEKLGKERDKITDEERGYFIGYVFAEILVNNFLSIEGEEITKGQFKEVIEGLSFYEKATFGIAYFSALNKSNTEELDASKNA